MGAAPGSELANRAQGVRHIAHIANFNINFNINHESDPPLTPFDALPYSYTTPLIVAQGDAAPEIAPPIPKWMKNDPRLQFFKDVKAGKTGYQASSFKYRPVGANIAPSLTIDVEVEWAPVIPQGLALDPKARETVGAYLKATGGNGKLYVGPTLINPARRACWILEIELGKQLGSWGPECRMTKILVSPKGRLVARDPSAKHQGPEYQEGDFYYTPAGRNTRDTIRFILDNGAGNQVEVIYNVEVGNDRMQRGSVDAQAVQLANNIP